MKKVKTEKEPKPFIIMAAQIKDDFCHYSYEITSGVSTGDKVAVKGVGIVDEDMHNAFRTFNAHMAVIDDVFKHSKVEIKSISKVHNHELTALFYCTGFKVRGEEGVNESIILMGSKSISSGGRIELETPQIPLDKLSSYEWWKELKEAADVARLEVELYKAGKCTQVEEKEDANQTTLGHGMTDEELEGAKVK